jgi:SAM-dependent methyltransferase
MVRVKTPEEVQQTFARGRRAQMGFLSKRATLGVTAAGLLGGVTAPIVSAAAAAVLATDFLVFVTRRARILREYTVGEPRLVTPEDFAAASTAFAQAGLPEPTMSDYEEAGGFSERPWANDLRYTFAVTQYRGGTVVDIGCGDGRLCWRYRICPPTSYIGIDPSASLIRALIDKTGGHARGVVSVAEATTLPDASVELLVCSECFEHLPHPEAAMREFARILKPGGRLVIQTPSAYTLRNYNPLHILVTRLGWWLPGLLQRTVVHENTFLHAFTYHWDFTRQDFVRYTAGLNLTLEMLTTATYRFNPAGSWSHRLGARIARWPGFNRLWWDLTVVLRKGEATERLA